MRLKHHLLRWLLILTCVSMTAGHVTTVYAQESSSDSSSSSDSGSSSSTDGSVGETFENADHSNSVNAGAPSAPGSSGVSDGAGSAASTAAPSYNGYSYSPSPSYGGSMPSMGDGAFSHPSSFASGDVKGNDGLGNGQPSIGGGYSNGYANSYSNPGFSYSYNTGLTTDTLATNNADVNPSTSSYSVAGSQTDVGALTGAGFWSGVAPVASGWDGGLAATASNPLADGLRNNKPDPYVGVYEDKSLALVAVDPLAPLNISITKDNAADVFAGVTWKNGLSTINGQTYQATKSPDQNGYTISMLSTTADAGSLTDRGYTSDMDATVGAPTKVANNIAIYDPPLEEIHPEAYLIPAMSGLKYLSSAKAAATVLEEVPIAVLDPNKIAHIFGNLEHGLSSIVSEFGTAEAAMAALQKTTQQAVENQNLSGLFETSVKLGDSLVTVRGVVQDGITKIGTAFVPK